MTKTFPSSISYITGIVLTGLGTLLLVLSFFVGFDQDSGAAEIGVALLLFAVGMVVFWMLFATNYKVDNTFIYYTSGPIRGKIEIQSIRKIEYKKGWYSNSTLKPALDQNGLSIYYNKFDDLYVSPKDRVEFVSLLLKINATILIKE